MPRTIHSRVRQTSKTQWQRTLIAAMAILMGGIGLAVHWIPGIEPGSAKFIAGTCWKVGFVMLVAWLASPQLERLGWERIRGTMLVAIVIVIVLYAIRPRIGAIAAFILVAGSAIAALGGWFRRFSGPSR
jgi:hypothetical protein